MLALHAWSLVHVGVDNLLVVRTVVRLVLEQGVPGRHPFEFQTDSDLQFGVWWILPVRGAGIASVVKVEGNATAVMVVRDEVRSAERKGKDQTDSAAGVGLRRQSLLMFAMLCAP